MCEGSRRALIPRIRVTVATRCVIPQVFTQSVLAVFKIDLVAVSVK